MTVKKTDAVLAPEIIDKPIITPDIPKPDQLINVPPEITTTHISTPVVQGLLRKSQNKFDLEDYEAAANYLERGINIAPNDPKLWQQLAKVRFKQGNYKQAKQLATKSNVLVESDGVLRAINEEIIYQSNVLLNP